jgi:lysophospholipase L1-like esterase
MEFRTVVDIPKPGFLIEPFEEMLFVGSCFADSIGQRFVENKFRATVNPYGTMYNPASVLHTVERFEGAPRVVFITLGTNHVYRLKETGEIVDNCQKRPAALFQEEELTVDECADYLRQTVELLCRRRPDVHVVFTVSPIRYRKYGYHESQLSKATLLLAVDKVCIGLNGLSRTSQARAVRESPCPSAAYFPAYEILMDELRDYRFYADDMLHPSSQAVAYIWQQLVAHYFSDAAKEFLREWAPLKAALNHRPFDADSEAYHAFMDKTMLKVAELQKKYPTFAP